MTRKQIDVEYRRMERTLHKLAWQCARRCGRTEEEAFGQACWLFMRATRGWRAGRGSAFTTYAHRAVHNGLATWGKKMDLSPWNGNKEQGLWLGQSVADNGRNTQRPTPPEEPRTHLAPDKLMEFNEWLSGLSCEARTVAGIIINGPSEALGVMFRDSAGLITALKRHLRRDRGWRHAQIWAALRELKREVRAR